MHACGYEQTIKEREKNTPQGLEVSKRINYPARKSGKNPK